MPVSIPLFCIGLLALLAACGGQEPTTILIEKETISEIVVTAEPTPTQTPNVQDTSTLSPDGGKNTSHSPAERIAFASNRNGNFDIYVMNADGSDQTNLTNNNPTDDRAPTWSPDGTKIAFSSYRNSYSDIYVMSADGSGQTNLTNNPAWDSLPTWSPDGTKIAFYSARDGKSEIYVMNIDGSNLTMLTTTTGSDNSPAWSPDGTKIAFVSFRDHNNEIYVMNADGSGQTNLTSNPADDRTPTWSPDGTKIAFHSVGRGIVAGQEDASAIFVINADGSGITNTTGFEAVAFNPDWSPDGGKIVFESWRDGNWEIYVMNANGSGQTNLTNSPITRQLDDKDPSWAP